MGRILIAQTTIDTEPTARKLAETAVQKKLAGCVHVDGPFTSVYRWNDRMETASEWRLTFKTSRRALTRLEAWLRGEHSFETPQWIWWEAEASDDYAEWVAQETRPSDGRTHLQTWCRPRVAGKGGDGRVAD